MGDSCYIHPKAINDSKDIGIGTRVWAFSHIMEGAIIGKNCNIGEQCYVEGGAKIGHGVTVKNGVAIWQGVAIEDYCFIGPYVVFTNDRLPRSPRSPFVQKRYEQQDWLMPTLIKTGAAIGANATMLCGIIIGEHALIGAGSVVRGDVLPFALMVGNPARQIGWACACGERLPREHEPKCKSCGRVYAIENGKMIPRWE
jgi:UDP-2-acetamido-3-amino-2,3-dideoxy-glucuronate N-acetyltransferase